MTDNIGAGLRLSGSRCQCSACGRYFNSTGAFDKHRSGLATDRHCERPADLGMSINASGYWITTPRPKGL